MQENNFDVEEFLSNFYKGTKEPSLAGIEFLMSEFGNPEKKLKVIHIAGTNGKGSCTEMMANILIKAGYKVGKFIGPHLEKYNERISIQNENIKNYEMADLILKIKPKIDKYNNKYAKNITLFELLTTMSILYFYENNCDFVVLETGLGGLYDCTNVVNSLVSIIASIGYDHMHILGNTLVQIAKQKVGIIKENSQTVFALSEDMEVNKMIEETCLERNNELHVVNKADIKNYSYNQEFQKFDYKGYKDIFINLKGEKQVFNSCICIECTDILRKMSYVISDTAMIEGLKTVVHKGRFEIINQNPLMIFDGAHNKPAIDNFLNSVKMYYENEKKVFVISILKTKDYKMILKELLLEEDSIFVFTDGNDKSKFVSKEIMYDFAKEYTKNKKLFKKNLEDSIDFIKENYTNHVTFFVGSFYVYGDVVKKI